MLMTSVTKSKKTLVSALLVTIGIILGYIESVFFPVSPLYGLKIGFSNIIVIYALYVFGTKNALLLGVMKSILTGLLFSGIVSIAYSVAGITFSVLSMHFVKRFSCFTEIGVSIFGSAAFQVGQITIACFFLGSTAPVYYLSYLLIGSAVCGTVSGSIVLALKNKLFSLKGFKNE